MEPELKAEKADGDFDESVESETIVQVDINKNKIKSPGKLQSRQCLLKGDKVFSLNWVEKLGWSSLFRYQQNCKYVNGMVVTVKDWTLGRLALQVAWEHGSIENVRQKSSHVGYADRIFVLDRESVSVGSKVHLIEDSGKQGVILRKRYLATGITTGRAQPEMIFEDIDVNILRRETYGAGYKNIKISYHGWIGVTSGYRTRLYLETKSSNLGSQYFTIVVDGTLSQSCAVGDQITLGLTILRNASFVGGDTESQSWLVNFIKLYNTTATIMDMEIDQLTVCWIGEESTPNVQPNEFEVPDSPHDIIAYDQLPSVHYLVGDYSSQVTPKSLWTYQGSPETWPKSKESWAQRWRKILDIDRWEYPESNGKREFDTSTFSDKSFTLETMYVRSIVSVLWKDGSETEANCGDVIPSYIGSVWSEMLNFRVGSVVRNRLDIRPGARYGVIVGFHGDNIAAIKWIVPGAEDEGPTITSSTISLYDLEEILEYSYLSKPNHCPLVSVAEEGSAIMGVVLGLSPENYKTRVRLVNNQERLFWPHEMVHYKCDVLHCPIENRWRLWYNHVACDMDDCSTEKEKKDESCSQQDFVTNIESTKMRFECVARVPPDNVFIDEDMLLRSRDADFGYAMGIELDEMENHLPEGMWIEHYIDRIDIFSALLAGPKGSIFEDYLFVFDIFIMENFPKSEPHLNFRSMGITVIPGHLSKSGAVVLPEKCSREDEDFSMSYIINILLEMKDFMGLPLDEIHDENLEQVNTVGIRQEEAEELYKYVTIALLDYTIAILTKPPQNWAYTIYQHFSQALPRIVERLNKGYIEIKQPNTAARDEKDLFADLLHSKTIKITWDKAFLKSITSRISTLEKIFSRLNCHNSCN